MKNILFILFVLASFGVQGQTMPLDSFYARGSQWVEYTYYVYGLGESKIIGRSYRVVGDSIINGWNYHLISSKMLGGYGTEAVVSGTETYYFQDSTDFGIIGGIRVAGNQVFFYRILASDSASSSNIDSNAFANMQGFPLDSEKIIYDYNVSVNDTVSWQTLNTTWGLYNVVRNIDSIYLPGGFYAKQVVFDSSVIGLPHQNYWIEGIGSSLGFLGSHCTNTTWGFFATHLLCYSTSTFSYKFPNSLPAAVADSCFDMSFLSVPTYKKQLNEIVFYPNPVTDDYINFEGSDLQEIEKLSVFDITGKLVIDLVHPFKNGNHKLAMIQEKGVYILKIAYPDNTTIMRKIIKL